MRRHKSKTSMELAFERIGYEVKEPVKSWPRIGAVKAVLIDMRTGKIAGHILSATRKDQSVENNKEHTAGSRIDAANVEMVKEFMERGKTAQDAVNAFGSPVERYKAAMEQAAAIKAQAVEELKERIEKDIQELNGFGFMFSLVSMEQPVQKRRGRPPNSSKVQTPIQQVPTKQEPVQEPVASPFQPGTQWDWIYQQIVRRGGEVTAADIAGIARGSKFPAMTMRDKANIALSGMAKRGVIIRTAPATYKLAPAKAARKRA